MGMVKWGNSVRNRGVWIMTKKKKGIKKKVNIWQELLLA